MRRAVVPAGRARRSWRAASSEPAAGRRDRHGDVCCCTPAGVGVAVRDRHADAAPPARRTVATGLSVPWGHRVPARRRRAGRRARRPARILRIPSGGGEAAARHDACRAWRAAGEGGLLGLAVSPRYARDRLVYAYFTSDADNRIVRFKLGGQVRDVLTGLQKAGIHNGGRIAFGPDGKLYAGVGDAGQHRQRAGPRRR